MLSCLSHVCFIAFAQQAQTGTMAGRIAWAGKQGITTGGKDAMILQDLSFADFP